MENTKLVNFTDLNLAQAQMVLEWRNNQKVRQWMYTQEEITLENHLRFIESLKNNDAKLYFLVQLNLENIGVIDFYNFSKNSCEFGLYANPNLQLAGIGRILEQVSIEYAFNTLKIKLLKLEVFEENIQVINLHKKFKFKITGEKIVNKKKVICMELINENREF